MNKIQINIESYRPSQNVVRKQTKTGQRIEFKAGWQKENRDDEVDSKSGPKFMHPSSRSEMSLANKRRQRSGNSL